MGEKLTSGAMPDDWRPRPDPPAEPSRWFDTGMPGGAIVDRHEYDVPAGLYDPPPVPERADVRTALHYARAAHASGSPHIFRTTACTGCRASITFYGRAEQMPDEPRCRKCGPPPTA